MGSRSRYAKFQENVFISNEIKLIFALHFFAKRPISLLRRQRRYISARPYLNSRVFCLHKIIDSHMFIKKHFCKHLSSFMNGGVN